MEGRPVIDIVRDMMPERLFEIVREIIECLHENEPPRYDRALVLQKERVKLRRKLMADVKAAHPQGIKQPGRIMDDILIEYSRDYKRRVFCSFCEAFIMPTNWRGDRCVGCHDRILLELHEDAKIDALHRLYTAKENCRS